MTVEHVPGVWRGKTSQAAIDAAKEWAKAEGLRVRTIVRVTERIDIPEWTPEGKAWQVTLAVDVPEVPA